MVAEGKGFYRPQFLPLPERLLLVIDDSPTKRYGPKVEGAEVHHNPTPGPADQPYLYGQLRKDAALRDLSPELKKGQRRGRGRPREYGKNRISLARRAGQKRRDNGSNSKLLCLNGL